MNLISELNEEQIKLLKEADIKVENKDYSNDECKYIVGQVMRHIMSFSKKDISDVANRYESVIDKIKVTKEIL